MSPTRSIIQQLTKSPGLPKGGSGHYASPAQTVTSRLAEARWSSDRVAELCSALEADGAKSVSAVGTGIDIGVLWKAICEVYAGSRHTYYMPNSTVYFESKRFHEAVKGSNIVCVKTTRFGGDFGAFIITDDSPDKVARKLAAAEVVEERLQEETTQFKTWTDQPPGLGVPGEILLSGLVDAGIKYGGFVLTGIEPWETAAALIRERVYPTDDIQAGGAFNYGASISPLMKDKSRPVVVIGRALGASMFVAVSTWDSPDKVARKLMAALSVRESKLTEGWQVMPHRLTRGEHAQESMINEDRGGPLVISQEFPEESPMYRIAENMERHGTKINGIISNFWGSAAYNAAIRAGYEASWTMSFRHSDGAVDANGRLVEQCVLVLGSLVTSAIAVCVHTSDSPEKVLRKLEAARFNTESLARQLIREATT